MRTISVVHSFHGMISELVAFGCAADFLKFTIKLCFIDNKGFLLHSLLSQQCTQYGGILNTFANFDNRVSLRDS